MLVTSAIYLYRAQLLQQLMFSFFKKSASQNIPESIYDFRLKAIDGGVIDFSAFKGKKILIVNTASFCGYTPQFEKLQQLHETYQHKLNIIGIPSNDFMFQDPLPNKQIASFCSTKYGVTFPMAAKVHVKGNSKTPLYTWLTEKQYNHFADSEVEWNFQKYLINEEGQLTHIFPHKMPPDALEILAAISA